MRRGCAVRLPGCARALALCIERECFGKESARRWCAEIGTAGAGMEEPDGRKRQAFAVSAAGDHGRPIRGSAAVIGRGQRRDSPSGPLGEGLPKLN